MAKVRRVWTPENSPPAQRQGSYRGLYVPIYSFKLHTNPEKCSVYIVHPGAGSPPMPCHDLCTCAFLLQRAPLVIAYTGDACDQTDATGGAAPVVRCRRQPHAVRRHPSRVQNLLSSRQGTGKDGATKAPLPVHWQHNTHTHLRRFRCGGRGMPQSHRGYQAEWHR